MKDQKRKSNMITLDDVRKNARVKELITRTDEFLGVIGYTEHGERHSSLAANIACNIMKRLKKSEKETNLAAIAAYLHDIGNVVNRGYHAQSGALLAYQVLVDMNMPFQDVMEVVAAIGNHDEKDGQPISDICASVILADKSDVHSSRVRNLERISQDIHDRVNYAAKSSFLRVDPENMSISLEIKIDTSLSQVMEYFEIFLSRMVVCRRAAEFLKMRIELEINGQRLL